MRENPLISIVTVVKNNLAGLMDTTAVINEQSYANIEHVVVDGQSVDGTKEWLESHQPKYLLRWVCESDGGLYEAMNKGISMCTGDIVLFLNGGDKFSSSEVLSLVAHDWANETWDWGYGAIRNVSDIDGTIINGYLHAPFRKRLFELGTRYVPHPATFMSRALISELGGFKPEFGVSADQDLIMRAAAASEPRVWVEFFSDFVLGGASTIHSGTKFYSRFGKIRQENNTMLLGSRTADMFLISAQKMLFRARYAVSRRVHK